MNHWITVFNNLFKSNPKINHLDIVLESNGEYSTPPSNNYTPINDKLQASFLNPVSNSNTFSNPTKQYPQSTSSNYNPPNKIPSTSTKTPEESPFSKFRIWGQKS